MGKGYVATEETQLSIKGTVEDTNDKVGSVKNTGEDTNTKITSAKTTAEDTNTKVGSVKGTVEATQTTVNSILSELQGQRPKRYGFRVKISESSPANRVEYLYDAVGLTPAYMNFGTGFNFGSWADIWFVKNNFPCMVKSNGAVDYQLNPNDYTKKADGTSSDVANVSYDGNAMSAIPCVWYKRWTDGDYYYFVACEEQYDETYYADVHTDENGIVQPYKYVAIFKGSLDSNSKLRSLSGKAPMQNAQASNELTYAQNNGSAWTIKEWGVWNLIADLLILMGKSTDSQSVYGQGHTTGGSSASDLMTTGSLNTAGQFYGYSDTTHAVKVFHLENWWGDRWDRIVGLVVVNGVAKAQMNSKGNAYNFTGSGYATMGAVMAASGYQVREYSGRLGTVPTATDAGGSSSQYECDYFWLNASITAVAIVGGNCNNDAWCGARYLDCNDGASNAYWNLGASLSLKNPS